MSDLSTLLRDAAETGPAPAPVDTTELWTRGRRQRLARRTAPVMAVLAVVGLGVGAVASTYSDDLLQPITSEEGAGATGFTALPDVKPIDLRELPAVDIEVDTTEIATITSVTTFTGARFDVAADGTLAWVDPVRGVLLQHPDDEAATVLGMPEPFLEVGDEWVVHTVQWGPDDRLYVTGQDPDAEARHVGLSQVLVLDRDGNVVGYRDNDAGQFSPLLFADGYAWQQQRDDDLPAGGDQRWQAVAELDGPVLPMPEQRATDRRSRTAPDGLRLDLDGVVRGAGDVDHQLVVQDGRDLRELLLDGRAVGWVSTDVHLPEGIRGAVAGLNLPQSWIEELTGQQRSAGRGLVFVGRDGAVFGLRLPPGEDGGHASIDEGAILVGRDGHLYLPQERADGSLLIRRFEEPLPLPIG